MGAHAKQLEAFTRPEEVDSRAVSIWEWYLNLRVSNWRTLEQGRWCAPVPRRNTQMWLMVSAAGNSKAAFVSSICCRFVCKSLPATQQPNIVQCSVDGTVEWGHLSIQFLFSSLFVSHVSPQTLLAFSARQFHHNLLTTTEPLDTLLVEETCLSEQL